jgi:hypothetical protein
LIKIRRDRLYFMSLGVLGEIRQALLAFSLYALKDLLCILRINSNTFRGFGDDFMYNKQP